MDHLDEKTIELYVLESEMVAPQRGVIEEHLRLCPGCRSMFDAIHAVYAEADEVLAAREEAAGQALTIRAMVETPAGPWGRAAAGRRKSLPARLLFLIVRNPMIAAGGFIAVLIGAFLLGSLVSPARRGPKDTNPSYVRAEKEFLVVYNKDGGELWRKHIGPRYDNSFLEQAGFPTSSTCTVRDIDGDGRNEVLAVFGLYANRWDSPNTVFCYSAESSVRWRYEVHRTITFGNDSFNDTYFAHAIVVDDLDNDGRMDVVVLAAIADFYPNVIIRLDGATGRFESEYWNPGALSNPVAVDLDSDGAKEIIVGGAHNGYHQGPVIVLDPRHIRGHAPAPVAYTPAGVPPGEEKYYILMPRADVAVLSKTGNAESKGFQLSPGKIVGFNLEEAVGGEHYTLVVLFDSTMHCTKIEDSNEFAVFHRRMEVEGKLTRKLDDAYLEDLRRGVQYWNGSKFVPEPVMNSHYLAAIRSTAQR